MSNSNNTKTKFKNLKESLINNNDKILGFIESIEKIIEENEEVSSIILAKEQGKELEEIRVLVSIALNIPFDEKGQPITGGLSTSSLVRQLIDTNSISNKKPINVERLREIIKLSETIYMKQSDPIDGMKNATVEAKMLRECCSYLHWLIP